MLIRPSHIADAHSMSRIYVQTWRDTYLGTVPYDYLLTMSVRQHERAFSYELKNKQIISFVAEDAGRVLGFITGGYERNGDDIYGGEIYTLYVQKNRQRQGVGTKLVAALARRFSHFGIYSMLVWVLKQNPYRRFYKKVNGIFLGTQQMQFADEMMDVQAYGWIDTSLIYR